MAASVPTAARLPALRWASGLKLGTVDLPKPLSAVLAARVGASYLSTFTGEVDAAERSAEDRFIDAELRTHLPADPRVALDAPIDFLPLHENPAQKLAGATPLSPAMSQQVRLGQLQALADDLLPRPFHSVAATQEYVKLNQSFPDRFSKPAAAEAWLDLERLCDPALVWEAYRTPDGTLVLVEAQPSAPPLPSVAQSDAARAFLHSRLTEHSAHPDAAAFVKALATTLPPDVVRFMDAIGMTLHLGTPEHAEAIHDDPCADLMRDLERCVPESARGQYIPTRVEAWLFDFTGTVEQQVEVMAHEINHGLDRALGEGGKTLSDSPEWLAIHARAQQASRRSYSFAASPFITENAKGNASEHLEDALNVMMRPLRNEWFGLSKARLTRADLQRINPEAFAFVHQAITERLPRMLREGTLQMRPSLEVRVEHLGTGARSTPAEDRTASDWDDVATAELLRAALHRDVDGAQRAVDGFRRAQAVALATRSSSFLPRESTGTSPEGLKELEAIAQTLVAYLRDGTIPQKPLSVALQEHALAEPARKKAMSQFPPCHAH